MELKSLKEIPATFSVVKMSLFICLAVSLLVSMGSLFWSYKLSSENLNTTYVITGDGKAIMLSKANSEVDQNRLPEIINHVKEFHKLYFEIDQYNYEQRISKALHLIGNSGRDMYLTMKGKGFYSNIIANNLKHELEIDSVLINHKTTPYKGQFYGKVIVKRTDQKMQNTKEVFSYFELHNVARTKENPHGLVIENYHVN